MKLCPKCYRTEPDDAISFCRADGARLVTDSLASDSTATAILPSLSRSGEISTQLLQQMPSIAVLSFSNLSADPENQYFCDGLAEELLNALAKVRGLKVVARTSAFSFKSKDVKVSEIGQALSVNTVLEGSVRKAGNRLRITVQLINVADGYHLWSERYDRQMEDIFDVQDEITLAVVDALKLKLLGEEKAVVLKRYTESAEAYQLYLKGRYFWWKTEAKEFAKSCDYFQRAVDADPTFGLGYCGLSGYYGVSAARGMLPSNEGWQRAEAALVKALELDDTLPEVHNNLAATRMFYHRDWAGAESAIKRAIELDPKYAEAHTLYPFCLAPMRRFDEAITEGQMALALDPLSPRIKHNLGNIFHYARRYDEAVRQYLEVLELEPNSRVVHQDLGDTYEQKGLHAEAVAEWQHAMRLAGDEELATTIGNALAESGIDGAVRAMALNRIERLHETERGEYVPAVEYARAYVRLSDIEQAFKWLEQACEERTIFSLFINVDPFYDPLRSDPRFADLMRRVGLPQ
jgi:TolB-like protein/Flp pilus assembly protein TadD